MDVLRELADGKYTGEIIDITIKDTPNGYPKVTWLLRIIGGAHDGECVEKNFYLKSRGAMNFLKKELKLIGFKVEDGKELKAMKQQIIGTRIKFTAQVNDFGYLVLYAKGVMEEVIKAAPPEEDAEDW